MTHVHDEPIRKITKEYNNEMDVNTIAYVYQDIVRNHIGGERTSDYDK